MRKPDEFSMKNPVLPLITLCLLVSGCSTGLKKEDDPGPSPATVITTNVEVGSAAELYQKARVLLDREQYESALNGFENLEATH
ncbi:MAG: hypothetical protein AAF404_15690, partial [Pseudomonadota bacterium]